MSGAVLLKENFIEDCSKTLYAAQKAYMLPLW